MSKNKIVIALNTKQDVGKLDLPPIIVNSKIDTSTLTTIGYYFRQKACNYSSSGEELVMIN